MSVTAIIFDVDGTLVDTNQIHLDGWLKSFKENDFDVNNDKLKMLIGKGGDNLIPDILGFKPSKDLEEKLNDIKAKEFKKDSEKKEFKVFDKSIELIKELKNRKIKTAIATSATKKDFKTLCKNIKIDLEELVDVLVTSEDVDSSKPDPDLIHVTLKELDLLPKNCLMVGDTSFDVESAKKADVNTIGVLTGFHSKKDLENAGAIKVFKDIKDFYSNIDDIID